MALFSKVPVHCNNCGNLFMTDFSQWDGRFCSAPNCAKEFQRKRAAATLGEEYFTKKEEGNENRIQAKN